MTLIMAVLLGVMTMCVMKFVNAEDRESLFNAIYTASLIMSNVYGMLILVVLLGHGLIKLPITLWKHPDNKYNLMNALSRADRVRRAYRTSLIEYHEQISICKTLEEQHATGFNRRFFDILMSEIPEHDLEGQKITHLKSIGGLEVKKGKVDENLIAQVRYSHKIAFFQYLRKKSRWLELFSEIDESVQKPIKYEEKDLNKKVSSLKLADSKQDENIKFDKLALRPKESDSKRIFIFRALAIVCMIWTLLVLSTETALIWDKEKTIVNWWVTSEFSTTLSIFMFSVVFMAGMTFSSYFTIFNLKILDEQ